MLVYYNNNINIYLGGFTLNKKKAIKVLSATAIAASAFVATAPAGADAAATDVQTLVKKAKDAGTVLKWAISTEGSADGKTRPYAQYNAAKAARDAAVAAINKLPAAQKAGYLADIEQNVNLHINRTMSYIDAITAGEKISEKKATLATQIEKNLIDDATEKAYHELSTEIRKQAILLDRVYGKSTRDAIRAQYKKSAEAVRDSVVFEVSAKIELDLAKKALVANNTADVEKHLAEAAKYMKDVKNEAMKAVLVKAQGEIEGQMTPAVTSVSAVNLNTIEVKFNKAVDSTDATTASNYTFDGSNLEGTVKLSSDKKTATITLDNAVTNKSYKTLSVKKDSINVDGSTTTYIPEASKALYFEDTTAPVVTEVSYSPDGEVVTVKFSETISSLGTIKVYDEKNLVVADESDFELATDGKSATLDTSSSAANLTNDKSYKVVFVGTEDLAGNNFANNRFESTFKKEKNDTVAPVLNSVTYVNNKTVRVSFSEGIKANATGKIADISLDGSSITAGIVVVDGTPSAAGEATLVSPGVYDVLLSTTQLTPGAHTVNINNFKDLAGNTVTTAVSKVFQTNTDTTAATITKTEVANKVVTFTFDETVNLGTASATLISPDGVHHSVASSAFGTTSKPNQITVNLGSIVTASPLAGSYTLNIVSGSIVDGATTPNTKAYDAKFALLNDTAKPSVSGVTIQSADNDTVVVTYNEPMGDSALNLDNYLLDGQKVFKSAIFDGNKQTVKLSLKDNALDISANRVLTIQNVTDTAGNVIDKVTRAATNYNENTKPTIVSATLIDLDTVRVTFSEANVSGLGGETPDFEFYANGSTTTIVAGTVTAVSGNAKAFDISFANSAKVTDLTKEISLKVLANNDVVDAAGNKLGTTGTVKVSGN